MIRCSKKGKQDLTTVTSCDPAAAVTCLFITCCQKKKAGHFAWVCVMCLWFYQLNIWWTNEWNKIIAESDHLQLLSLISDGCISQLTLKIINGQLFFFYKLSSSANNHISKIFRKHTKLLRIFCVSLTEFYIQSTVFSVTCFKQSQYVLSEWDPSFCTKVKP